MRTDFLYRLAVPALRALLPLFSRRRLRGAEHLPRTGGAIVVCNHISVTDPLFLVDAVTRAGRRPRAMATGGLFRHWLLGAVLRGIGLSIRALFGQNLAQTALLGLTAGLAALPLGAALAWMLVHVINRRSFGWTMDFVVARYGDFVLLRPPVKATTWLLWFGPALLLIAAGLFLWVRARRSSLVPLGPAPLDDEEEKKLATLIGDEPPHRGSSP